MIRLDKDVTDPRLVKALAHPLRVRILAVLDEHVASPTELAEELHAPLGNVSYHVRTLLSLGLIELVKETPRRGSVEHHYSAVARPAISDQAWEAVPESVKRAMIGAALQQAGVYVNAAAAAGSFNRANAHLSRTPLELDDEGWHAVAEELLKFMDRAQEIERDCSERLKDATREPDPRAAADDALREPDGARGRRRRRPFARRRRGQSPRAPAARRGLRAPDAGAVAAPRARRRGRQATPGACAGRRAARCAALEGCAAGPAWLEPGVRTPGLGFGRPRGSNLSEGSNDKPGLRPPQSRGPRPAWLLHW